MRRKDASWEEVMAGVVVERRREGVSRIKRMRDVSTAESAAVIVLRMAARVGVVSVCVCAWVVDEVVVVLGWAGGCCVGGGRVGAGLRAGSGVRAGTDVLAAVVLGV